MNPKRFGFGAVVARKHGAKASQFDVFGAFCIVSTSTLWSGSRLPKGTEHLFADTNSPTAYLLGGLIYIKKGVRMKKSVIFAIASLFPFVSFAEPVNFATYDVAVVTAFESCALLEENTDHKIYQCPSDTPWIVDMKQNEPNGMFRSNFDSDENVFNLVLNDTEHEYVEVAFDDAGICEENQTAVRIKIAQPSDQLWAFVGCKQN